MRTLTLMLAACAASTLNWSAAGRAAPASTEQTLPRITARTVGQGPAVVLIPGLASPASVFDDVASKIGRNHKLIFVQVNGFAGAPVNGAPDDKLLPEVVDEIAAYLAANHVDRPAVIGHSMGGLLGMMLAKAHPQAVGKLMIVDSLPFYGILFGPGATPDAVRPIVEQMRQAMVSGGVPKEAPPHMSNSAAGRAQVLEWLTASDPKVVGEALVEDATTDVRPELPALSSLPVTVVYAVASPEAKAVVSGIYGEAYKALPQAKLVPIDGSEHFIMLDQPGAFDAAVEEFLG